MTFRWLVQIHADFTSNRVFSLFSDSFYYLCYFRDKVIICEVCVHIKHVSKSVTQLDSCRKVCSGYCGSFGFLITLSKLKLTLINPIPIPKINPIVKSKIDGCKDMPLIDSFLFTAEITVLFVANRQWNTLEIVCGRPM